MMRNR
jgi:hypothetical protein